MKKHYLPCLLAFVILVSCAGDDTDFEFAEEATLPSFVAIGEDLETVWQLNYNGASQNAQIEDIGTQLAIDPNYLTLRQTGNQLSFYSFDSGFFDLSQKDVVTGDIQIFDRFYQNTDQRSVVWGINNETEVFFGFFAPLGSTNLAVRQIGLQDLQGQDLLLEADITRLYQPVYERNKLFIPYEDGSNIFKVGVYETNTQQLRVTLNFGTARPSIFMNADGNLAVLKFDSNTGLSLDIFDFDSIQLLQTTPLDLNQVFPVGALEAELQGDALYYEYTFVQPSALNSGPAIFNLGSQQNQILDLRGIIEQLETEPTNDLTLTTQRFSPRDNVFYVGYANLAENRTDEGGILILSREGELLQDIRLDFVPTYILKD